MCTMIADALSHELLNYTHCGEIILLSDSIHTCQAYLCPINKLWGYFYKAIKNKNFNNIFGNFIITCK